MSSLLPAGSITGAPKQKAIELIDQLEPVARGPYTVFDVSFAHR